MSGSSEGKAFIWETDHPAEPYAILPGHVGEVGAVAWSNLDLERIATGTDDGVVRIWDCSPPRDNGVCKHTPPCTLRADLSRTMAFKDFKSAGALASEIIRANYRGREPEPEI